MSGSLKIVDGGDSRSAPVRIAHVTTVDLTLHALLLGQLCAFREAGLDVTAISAPGPGVAQVEAAGIRHLPWTHATRSWAPRRDILALRELAALFRRERFDLVHTHTPKAGVIGRIAARLAGVPCVVNTVHGIYARPEDPRWKRAAVMGLEALAARFSDLELYLSPDDLARARRAGMVDPPRSVLLGNATDLSRFHPQQLDGEAVEALRRELGIGPDALVVGTVGRLVREKGYPELFEAARSVGRERRGVRFLVVGGPDPQKRDSLTADELERARPDVTFLGWREDVREALSLMDVFVLASWREGVPRSAIEAAAMGKAMVLTDIPGCRQVARDGREAVFVPVGRADALAGAIAGLIEDPARRARLGTAARRRAMERFDERRSVEVQLAWYRWLLRRKGRGAGPVSGNGHGDVRIRPARPADASALARLHRDGLPGAFLPALGNGFLLRLYRALAADRDAVALVAENGAGVVGYATGVVSVRRFYRRFYLRHGVAAAIAAAPRLMRPGVLRRALETARYPLDGERLPDAELLSIAVDPAWQGRGLGRALGTGIVNGLRDRRATGIKVVVGSDNGPANALYERIGFHRWGEIAVHDGEASNVWVTWPS